MDGAPHFADVLTCVVVFGIGEGDAAIDVGMVLVEGMDALIDYKVYLGSGECLSQTVAECHGEDAVAYPAESDYEYVIDCLLHYEKRILR